MSVNLSKKVGPLPIWAWGGAVALGIVIFYFRKNSGAGQVTAGNLTPQPTLDPTEGSFPMPSGLSGGGSAPEVPTPITTQDIADAVSSQLIPVLSTIPYASVPGEQSYGGGEDVSSFVTTFTALREAGFLPPGTPPPASTGAATSKPQAHTTPKHVSQRVNRSPGNPRKGQTYRVVKNPKGQKSGTYHVYGHGKTARYVRVRK